MEHRMEERELPAVSPAVSRRRFLHALAAGAGLVSTAALAGCAGSGQGAAQAGSEEVPAIFDSAHEVEIHTASLAMVGDVLVHQGVWESGELSDGSYNFDHLFAPMADDFAAADIAIVNQETVLGGIEMGISGYPAFNSPQEIGDAEVGAGVNVVAAATNHALDKGYSGIEAELAYWESAHPEVTCLGIATSKELAGSITCFVRDGITIALLNYTEISNAGLPSSAPWCLRMLDEDTVTADVEAARELGADFVVVLPHWGTEYVTEPTGAEEAWAALFLELGVDVVIGTHPHVIQPVEVLEREDGHRMLVFWSLGNYVSGQKAKERLVGGMAQVTFESVDGELGIAGYQLVPTVTHRARGTAYTTYRLDAYTEELAAENRILEVEDCGDFTRAWCVDFCAAVLGDGFDAGTCVLTGAV